MPVCFALNTTRSVPAIERPRFSAWFLPFFSLINKTQSGVSSAKAMADDVHLVRVVPPQRQLRDCLQIPRPLIKTLDVTSPFAAESRAPAIDDINRMAQSGHESSGLDEPSGMAFQPMSQDYWTARAICSEHAHGNLHTAFINPFHRSFLMCHRHLGNGRNHIAQPVAWRDLAARLISGAAGS